MPESLIHVILHSVHVLQIYRQSFIRKDTYHYWNNIRFRIQFQRLFFLFKYEEMFKIKCNLS